MKLYNKAYWIKSIGLVLVMGHFFAIQAGDTPPPFGDQLKDIRKEKAKKYIEYKEKAKREDTFFRKVKRGWNRLWGGDKKPKRSDKNKKRIYTLADLEKRRRSQHNSVSIFTPRNILLGVVYVVLVTLIASIIVEGIARIWRKETPKKPSKIHKKVTKKTIRKPT